MTLVDLIKDSTKGYANLKGYGLKEATLTIVYIEPVPKVKGAIKVAINEKEYYCKGNKIYESIEDMKSLKSLFGL